MRSRWYRRFGGRKVTRIFEESSSSGNDVCVGGDSSGVIERRWLPITDCLKGKNVA